MNGLLFEDCGSTLSYRQTLPAASVSISNPGYFYFSATNIIDTATAASQFALQAGGSGVAACSITRQQPDRVVGLSAVRARVARRRDRGREQ